MNGGDSYYDTHSESPCSCCGKISVWTHEIDEDHGDVRWKCFNCGASGIEEGPDY